MAERIPERLAYSPTEAAQLVDVSRPTIYRWMNMEGFPVARIGGCVRIPADAFRVWLERQAGVGIEETTPHG